MFNYNKRFRIIKLKSNINNMMEFVYDKLIDKLPSESMQILDYERCHNIEALPLRFTVEREDYLVSDLYGISVTLGNDYSLFRYWLETEEEEEDYCGDVEYETDANYQHYNLYSNDDYSYITHEGLKIIQKKALKAVFKDVKALSPGLKYFCHCYNDQKGFYKLAKRFGFDRIGNSKYLVRYPNNFKANTILISFVEKHWGDDWGVKVYDLSYRLYIKFKLK